MLNGVNFGMDGLSLDNTTWYNSKTGDSFKVRSNYFEDNNMILQAYDGRQFNLNQLNDYVQIKGEPPKGPINPPKHVKDEIPPEVASMLASKDEPTVEEFMDPEDLAILNGMKATNDTVPQSRALKQDGIQFPVMLSSQKKATNYDIIDRALSKTDMPDFVINMKWKNFPQMELKMLSDIMDVPMDEITDYYLNKITNEFDDFLDNMKEQLKSYLMERMVEPTQPETVKPKPTKKSTKTNETRKTK